MKRFVAWGIGFGNRYRFDLFFRTKCNVIALQIFFVLLVLMLVGFSYDYIYRDITKTIINQVLNTINTSRGTTPEALQSLTGTLEYFTTKNFLVIIVLVVSITALFGYLIARITLIPARNSLSSQKQFIGNIAHELRTPLSIIKTNIEVALLQNNFEEKRIKKILQSNIEELDRISDTINNLISFNRLARPERTHFERVDLEKTVNFVVKELSGFSKSKNLHVGVEITGRNIIQGKSVALEQIVMNLLKNAISYTPRGGTIHLRLRSNSQKFIELSVEDSGIGINRKDLFHILEPFYRADPSRARIHGGSGLGLAIVNELVKLHKGTIFIKSALKQGTTVTISFPPLNKIVSEDS